MSDEKKIAAPRSLAELDAVLGGIREGEATDHRAKDSRRTALLAGWNQIAPLLDAAIEHVNAVLSKHGYNAIELAAPQFNDTDASSYGAEGRIPGVNYGDLLVVLSGEMILYVNANCGGHWSEGYAVDLRGVTVDAIAEAIAKVAKDLIVEEPA